MEQKEVILRPIKGYEDVYKIDSYGNVYSVKFKRLLTPLIGKTGYARISLYKKENIKLFSVHRLVAEHFIPNPKNKKTVNHIDGCKLNNKVDNLEWATQKENNVHAYTSGLKVLPKGKDDKRSQPILQIDLDGNLIQEWSCAREAQRIGGFRQSNIWHCLVGNQKKSQGFIWKYKTAKK